MSDKKDQQKDPQDSKQLAKESKHEEFSKRDQSKTEVEALEAMLKKRKDSDAD